MAVPPKLAGTILPLGLSKPHAKHTIELYLDYVCPFSAKMFKTIYTGLLPKLSSDKKYSENVTVILRPQIQPWHPSSTLVHESALAVNAVAADSFWQYSSALFDKQKEYFDVNVVNESRNNTYKRLAALAKSSVGANEQEIYDLLKIPEQGEDGNLNVGNKITNDLKRTIKASYYLGLWDLMSLLSIYANRLVGVHVTPTVLFNGVEEGSISSSWTVDQWSEWLEKNVV